MQSAQLDTKEVKSDTYELRGSEVVDKINGRGAGILSLEADAAGQED